MTSMLVFNGMILTIVIGVVIIAIKSVKDVEKNNKYKHNKKHI